MALTKTKTPDAAATAVMNGDVAESKFEDTATDMPEQAEATDTEQATASVAATTAIAKAATTAVSVQQDVFGAHLPADLKQMLAEADFGVLPRVIADQGGLSVANEKIDLGKWISGQILLAQNSYICSPGTDSEEAKKLVKYSKDGVTIDDTGDFCTQYIAGLQAEGYKDAGLKHYLNITVMVEDADDKVAAEDYIGSIVVVQMSPESRKKFQRYFILARLKSTQTGSLDGLDRVKFSAVKKSGSGRNWTEIDTTIQK